jgi:hypothetical protein
MSAAISYANRRLSAALCLLLLGVAPLPGATPDPNTPSADSIFASAKGVWRARSAPPFARYSLLERYTWRRRVHDNWWHVVYRDRDRRLALVRIILPDQEAARMRGTSVGINFRIHNGAAHADTLETNPDADAFPILDPIVDPDASFGLSRREAQADLGGPRPYGVTMPSPDGSVASPSASPSLEPATPLPSALDLATTTGAGTASATEKPLRELARVEAVARDYRIALAGVERVRDEDAYHLTLVPVREPRTYRLRDLWVATNNYETLRLTVDGLFSGRPYDDARWTVSFVDFGGLAYVGQIRSEETLRFGVDRYVNGLEYDFVDYSFPTDMSPMEFERLQ